MPKKKKKPKSKKKTSKKSRRKIKKKSSKKTKSLRKKNKSKKKVSKKIKKDTSSSTSELIFKTKPEWIKSSLANKAQYQKNIMTLLKIIMFSGKKKEKELLGLSLIKK